MATLDDLRNRVRSQTQTTNQELFNSDIDTWLQEAFNRTVAAAVAWPFYETVVSIVWPASTPTQPLPASPDQIDANGIVSLVDLDTGIRLEMVDYEWAEDIYTNLTVVPFTPVQYSIWGGDIYLWPTPDFDDPRNYRLRGYRRPRDWIAGGASAEPDCDDRLHLALAHYATALAYAQQEDEVLEDKYMQRWQRDVQLAAEIIIEPGRDRPLTYGPKYAPSVLPIRGWGFGAP